MTDEQLQAIKARAEAATAAFIAHAREDVSALVAEVERLRAQLDAVPVEEICRLMYDCQTVDDERVIVAWAQANDPQREAA